MSTSSETTIGSPQSDIESVRVLADAITVALKDNNADKRFIDINRIPLICLSITGIHQSLNELKRDMKEMIEQTQGRYVTKDQFSPFRQIVMGMVGLVLAGFIGALLTTVLRSKGG